jgi:hypothetical protein
MNYKIQEAKRHMLNTLAERKIKHQVNDFPSGCSMIDIWIADRFYVIQIEHESIGISLVDGSDFSTIPDERFFDLNEFSAKLTEILATDTQ